MRRTQLLPVLLAGLLVTVSCGGGGQSNTGGPVDSISEVESATVRIVTTGGLIPPEIGELVESGGSGTGF